MDTTIQPGGSPIQGPAHIPPTVSNKTGGVEAKPAKYDFNVNIPLPPPLMAGLQLMKQRLL